MEFTASKLLTTGAAILSCFYVLAVAGTTILGWSTGKSPRIKLIVLPPLFLLAIPLWYLAKHVIKKIQLKARDNPAEAKDTNDTV